MDTSDSLIRQLDRSACVEFVALSPLRESRATVQFTGDFQGQRVLWEVAIEALDQSGTQQLQHYINVSATQDASRFSAEIGLSVIRVDVPTVLKTIHMIRNYKALKIGRHTWPVKSGAV